MSDFPRQKRNAAVELFFQPYKEQVRKVGIWKSRERGGTGDIVGAADREQCVKFDMDAAALLARTQPRG